MNEQEIIAAEDDYVKMALTVGMILNQLASAHHALTRLPQALDGVLPKYREIVAKMREATALRPEGQERDDANGYLDHTTAILDALGKVAVDPAALQSVTNLLEIQQKQVEAMLRDIKENAPGVQ